MPTSQTKVSSGLYRVGIPGMGVIGLQQLTNPAIPAGSQILRVWYDVVVQPASAGAATLAIGIDAGAGTAKAATLVTDGTYAAGPQTTSVNPSTLGITTAGAHITMTVAVAALTGGEILVSVEYTPAA